MISDKEVRKIARLCRIRLEDKEIHHFSQQLSNIMEMIDNLKSVDTENVEPLTSVCDMTLRTRSDQVKEGSIVEDLFSNVPGRQKDLAKEVKCYVVPKVVE